jgi:hypothetical protein
MRDLIGTNHPHSTYTDISLLSLAFAERVLQKDILERLQYLFKSSNNSSIARVGQNSIMRLNLNSIQQKNCKKLRAISLNWSI